MSTTAFADRRTLDFLLFDVLQVQALTALPRFAEHNRETFGAALNTAWQIAEREYVPLNTALDAHEPECVDGRVVRPAELSRSLQLALSSTAEAGFIAAAFGTEWGGMQLPQVVAQACGAVFKAASIAIDTHTSLSIGVARMLASFGTPAQQARYLPPLLAGRWFGTMVLTEPQAGSSLAEVRASATPRTGGGYLIRGQKIFITAGDHELADNIVHLVLARLPDAPAGTKGLSLFIVPKRRVDAGGVPGLPNDVQLAGLIHKMGSKGTTSALLHFGERNQCMGELLGAPHQGLACMFQMMNEARINVGIASCALAGAGYQHALAYSRDRVQGRGATGAPQPIIRHADVRRLLLTQKCIADGGLALCLQGALWADRHAAARSDDERREAGALLDLLTPVIKAWCAEQGHRANSLAIQVLGGYGYTRDHPVEQHYRDNRLNSIHEGTDGIQALDLVGRKLHANDGAAFELLTREVNATLAAARRSEPLCDLADALATAWSELRTTTRLLQLALTTPDAPRALALASTYLQVLSHHVIAWMWLRLALAAQPHVDAFHRGQLLAARFFFAHELPPALAQHRLLRHLDPLLVELDDAQL
jgi:butyryl-CoA dehydrogenase